MPVWEISVYCIKWSIMPVCRWLWQTHTWWRGWRCCTALCWPSSFSSPSTQGMGCEEPEMQDTASPSFAGIFPSLRQSFWRCGNQHTLLNVVDHFYVALFSALEQTHCTRVWFWMSDLSFDSAFLNICQSGVLCLLIVHFEYPPKWCAYCAVWL